MAFCKCIPRFATQPTSSLLFLPSAISVVKFHCQLLDCFELGSSPWCGEPPRETSNAQPCVTHTAAFPGCSGLGVTPSARNLLITVNGPSKVLTEPVLTPNGVLLERMLMARSRSRDSNWPTPARIANRPVPNTSQATPKRGIII